MERKTRAGASVLIALGTLAATLLLMAGPAGAGADPTSQHSGGADAIDHSTASGGCVAAHGSVCSGSGVAIDNSTSSGDAVAVNGSVGSGCSAAFDVSTASGGDCARHEVDHRPRRDHEGHEGEAPEGEGAPSAGPATPTAATSLAFTGSSTGPLAAAGAAALVLGMLLMALSSERRRPAHSS
jgi:hypothetical protein